MKETILIKKKINYQALLVNSRWKQQHLPPVFQDIQSIDF